MSSSVAKRGSSTPSSPAAARAFAYSQISALSFSVSPNGLRYHSPTGIPSHTAHRIKSRSKQGKQSVQTGIIAQVTSPTLTHIKSSKDNKSIKGVFGAGTPGVAVLGQGRLTQSQPARSQPHCLVPCASHLNQCVVVNIPQRPLDRSGLVHPQAKDDRA